MYDDDLDLSDFDMQDFKTGLEFESYCADLLRRNNYTEVRLTGYTDHGVDILAKKDNKLYAFQCKLRRTHKVSRDAIEQVYTGKNLYHADVGVLMTNAEVTKNARLDAIRLDIQVWESYYLRLLSDTVI